MNVEKTGKAVLIACLLLVVPWAGFAYTPDSPFTTDLIAGNSSHKAAVDVGDVLVWNDPDNLYVKYSATDGWCITETELEVALSPDAIPQTRSGNPIPGKFTYKGEHACVGEYTIVIPLPDDLSEELFMAAHATVYGSTGEGTASYAGAWADGSDFPGKNWAKYCSFILQANDECPCFTESSLCTAYASDCAGTGGTNLCGPPLVLGDTNMKGLLWRSPSDFSFNAVYATPPICITQSMVASSTVGASSAAVSACERIIEGFDPAVCIEQ